MLQMMWYVIFLMMWYVIFLIRGEPLTIKATKVLHTTAYAILTRWVAWHFALDYT
jgi:hypothetical protein